MQTIIIKLDSRKLKNPDLDIRYLLPERIEEFTDKRVADNGYDYLNQFELGMWLETENASAEVGKIIELIKSEKFCENDLSESAEIFISEADCAEIDSCEKVFPK